MVKVSLKRYSIQSLYAVKSCQNQIHMIVASSNNPNLIVRSLGQRTCSLFVSCKCAQTVTTVCWPYMSASLSLNSVCVASKAELHYFILVPVKYTADVLTLLILGGWAVGYKRKSTNGGSTCWKRQYTENDEQLRPLLLVCFWMCGISSLSYFLKLSLRKLCLTKRIVISHRLLLRDLNILLPVYWKRGPWECFLPCHNSASN